jgi:hypothetical protein
MNEETSYSNNKQKQKQKKEKNVLGKWGWGKRNHTRGDKAHVDFKTYLNNEMTMSKSQAYSVGRKRNHTRGDKAHVDFKTMYSKVKLDASN